MSRASAAITRKRMWQIKMEPATHWWIARLTTAQGEALRLAKALWVMSNLEAVSLLTSFLRRINPETNELNKLLNETLILKNECGAGQSVTAGCLMVQTQLHCSSCSWSNQVTRAAGGYVQQKLNEHTFYITLRTLTTFYWSAACFAENTLQTLNDYTYWRK